MNVTTLDQLITASNANEHAEQQRVVDELKQELHAPYDTAKSNQGAVEKAVKEARAFVEQLNALAAKCSKPLPSPVIHHLSAMNLLIKEVPRQVQEGLTAYEQLSFKQVAWKDGKTVDVNERRAVPASIRALLNSWNGAVEGLRSLRGQIDTCLEQTQWPSGFTPPATIPLAPEPTPEIRVRT